MSTEEAVAFLYAIPDIGMNEDITEEIKAYAESDVKYPRRYKVRPRVYFIIIKTEASTLLEFKEKGNSKEVVGMVLNNSVSKLQGVGVNDVNPGWYEGSLNFKRVVPIPPTGKFEYKDTLFVARCKANSGMECYNLIVEHLKQRVDNRSQFPAARGRNFQFQYLGRWK